MQTSFSLAQLADPDMGDTRTPLRPSAHDTHASRAAILTIMGALGVVLLVLGWALGAFLEWW